ncbi:hypothetical protein J4444_01790 [Candidatus Woesearchaeota archaeon]|nr:hypothetical protein [Candidatus Woesearchaeota archaeon]
MNDPIATSLVGLSLFSEGALKLREMNKCWLEKFATNDDVLKELDYFIKTPEFIQFIREVLIKVAYETREEKRKVLLHAAWNYILKEKKFTFDERISLLYLLDNLSGIEITYLILVYSNKQIPIEIGREINRLNSKHKLASIGLLDTDYSSFQNALERVKKDMDEQKKELNYFVQSKEQSFRSHYGTENYNPFFNSIEIKYKQNLLGRKLVELICIEEII